MSKLDQRGTTGSPNTADFVLATDTTCQPVFIWAAVKINCCCLVWKYRLSLFGGALSLYSVLFKFKSTLHNAKIQRNWLHEFRSLYCRGWIKGALVQIRMTVTNIRSMILWKQKRISLWVYPSSGVPFSTKGYRWVIAKVISKLEHRDDQERKSKRKWKGHMKQKGKHKIDGIQNWIQNQFWFTSEFNCV